MAVCVNDAANNRPVRFGGQKCSTDATGGDCPPGYAYSSSRTAPSGKRRRGHPYCFGDFVNLVDRYQAVCHKAAGSYPADVNSLRACCQGRTRPSECKPGYCVGSNNCKTMAHNECPGPHCDSWKAQYAPQYHAAMQTSCSAALSGQNCKEWCSDNPGKCDDSVMAYCNSVAYVTRLAGGAKKDPLCGCLRPHSSRFFAAGTNPVCYDKKCFRHGYRTVNMAVPPYGTASPCPSVINCIQTIDVEGSNNIISDVRLSQDCAPKPKPKHHAPAPVGPRAGGQAAPLWKKSIREAGIAGTRLWTASKQTVKVSNLRVPYWAFIVLIVLVLLVGSGMSGRTKGVLVPSAGLPLPASTKR